MFTGLGTHGVASIFHLKSNPLNTDQFGGPGMFTQIFDFFQSKTIEELFIFFGIAPYLLVKYLFGLFGIFF